MATINQILQKINPIVEKGIAPKERTGFYAFFHYRVKPFYSLLLILIIVSIFGALWRLYGLEELYKPIKIGYSALRSGQVSTAILGSGQEVIGSKTGKKYYFPWCGTVKNIKLENQVKFGSAQEAIRAGFTPGGNCKGL